MLVLGPFALGCLTDLVTDLEHFYTSIIDLLDDPDEKDEVEQLLMWWNRYGPHIDSFLY